MGMYGFLGELTLASPRNHEWRKKVGVVERTKEAAQKSESFRRPKRPLNDFSPLDYSWGLRGHCDPKTAFITTSIVKKACIHLDWRRRGSLPARAQVKQIKSGSAEAEAKADAAREAALLLREGARARASNARRSAFSAQARLRQV